MKKLLCILCVMLMLVGCSKTLNNNINTDATEIDSSDTTEEKEMKVFLLSSIKTYLPDNSLHSYEEYKYDDNCSLIQRDEYMGYYDPSYHIEMHEEYNSYGDDIYHVVSDVRGNKVDKYEYNYENIYDENNRLLKQTVVSENDYKEEKAYAYDENGNVIEYNYAYYNKDGINTISRTIYTYEYDENGNIIKRTGVSSNGNTFTTEYDENGSIINSNEIKEYDENGNLIKSGVEDIYSIYEYDDNNRCISEEIYTYGKLDKKWSYEYDGDNNIKKEICYYNDGKMICWREYTYEEKIVTEYNPAKVPGKYTADCMITTSGVL